MDELEPELKGSVLALIARAEGLPIVNVSGRDGTPYVARRVYGLRLDEEGTFLGEWDWVDPPEVRPDELTEGLAISAPDCLRIGRGWWCDA
jgi:hypothetical protein